MKISFTNIQINFSLELEYFRDYISFNKEKLLARTELLKKQLNEDQYENPDLPMNLVYHNDLNKIPSLFYSSSILILFSILESTLNDICKQIIKTTKIPLSIDDYNGNNYVGKTRKFLETFGLINFLKFDKNWIEITKFQKLRNIIVHENSFVGEPDTENRRKNKALLTGLKITEYNNGRTQFFINNDLPILRFIENAENYVQNIIEQAASREYIEFDEKFLNGIDFAEDVPF